MNAKDRIQELYDEILSFRFTDAMKVISLCEELNTLSEQEGNNYAKAYALLYLCDSHISLSQLEKAFQYGAEALHNITLHHIDSLLGAVYNLIAIIFVLKHDDLTALSYYLKGLDAAIDSNNKQLQCILYSNIGSTFSNYDSEIGLKYLLLSEQTNEALQQKSTEPMDEVTLYHAEIQISNIAISLIHSHKYQEALDKITLYLNDRTDHMPFYIRIPFFYIQIVAYHQLGMFYDAEKVCCQVTEYLKSYQSHTKYFDLIFLIVKEMIRLGLYTNAKKMIDILATYDNIKENETDAWHFAQLRILYARKTQDTHSLLDYYRNFYACQVQKSQTRQANYITSIENKLALEKELKLKQYYQKDTADLEEISEKDALTGLYNRYGLHKYYEQHFNNCCRLHQNFGLVIIDIDYFKSFNDTKGHLAGDSCIQSLAKIIRTATGKEFYCTRYGGDEFFIVCHNIASSVFEQVIASIMAGVRNLKIPFATNPAGFVTVSIGAVLAIPTEKQTVSQFISSADAALYKVKESSKNNYMITNSIAF